MKRTAMAGAMFATARLAPVHPTSRRPAAIALAARALRAAGRKAKLKELSHG